MNSVISSAQLEVGQWVQFANTDKTEKLNFITEIFCEEKERLLVISREDSFMDRCRCYLIDTSGTPHDFSGSQFDFKGEIRVVSRESVETIHGIEKVNKVYEAAQKHLEKCKAYFAKYPAQVLGKDNTP